MEYEHGKVVIFLSYHSGPTLNLNLLFVSTGSIFKCFLCPQSILDHIEWTAHILSHFQQKHCNGCNNNIICIGDVWYQPHNDLCGAIKEENACEFSYIEPMELVFEQPESNENNDFETKFLPEHNEYYDLDESIECVDDDKMRTDPVEPIKNHKANEDNTANKNVKSTPSRTRKGEGRFDSLYCVDCDKSFKSKAGLKSHYFTVHNNVMNTESAVLECDECARPFKGAQALKTHKRAMHSNEVPNTNTFKCDACHESFAYVMQLAKHTKEHTELEQFKCPICFRPFTSYDSYYFHVYEHPYSQIQAIGTEKQIQRPFTCTACDHVSRSTLTLIIHMQTHADLTQFGCVYHNCDEDFSSYDELYRHVLKHQQNEFIEKSSNPVQPNKTPWPNQRVTCDICSKTFYDKSSINKHMRAKHIPKDPIKATYRCELCLLQYDNRLRLESHVRDYHVKTNRILVHRHKCCSCSQSFRYITPLLEHLVTHTELTEYTCQLNDCGHKVTEIDALRRHLKEHTKKPRLPPSACTKCNQIKKDENHVCQPADLALAEKSSCAQYRKICDHCGAKFCSVSDLRYHMNSVNGIKPYKCEYCDKSFARPAFRRVHQRSHTRETHYKCKQSGCDSAFMDFRQLTRHEWRVHDLYRRRYPCTACDKVFPDTQLLRAHAKVHNVFTTKVRTKKRKRK